MASINKHGVKITNLSDAARRIPDWPLYCGGHTQINYDMRDGRIILEDHVGSSWCEYDSPNIIYVTDLDYHPTQQDLVDRIALSLACRVGLITECDRDYYRYDLAIAALERLTRKQIADAVAKAITPDY